MLIYPWYNAKKRNFETNCVKFVFLVVFILLWSIQRQISKVMYEESTTPFLLFEEFVVIFILTDQIMMNSAKNTKNINKFFYFVDKLDESEKETKEKFNYVKYFCIFWNVGFLGGAFFMCSMLIIELRISFALQKLFEMFSFYYMQAGIVWKTILCYRMKTKLENVNKMLENVDVTRGHSHDVHNLLDELIIQHNMIVNWVDVFNELFGRQILLVKINESFQVLVALDMYFSDFFKRTMQSNSGGFFLVSMTVYTQV